VDKVNRVVPSPKMKKSNGCDKEIHNAAQLATLKYYKLGTDQQLGLSLLLIIPLP
jgi:hypothetical protein